MGGSPVDKTASWLADFRECPKIVDSGLPPDSFTKSKTIRDTGSLEPAIVTPRVSRNRRFANSIVPAGMSVNLVSTTKSATASVRPKIDRFTPML